jgi:hypothetical protein
MSTTLREVVLGELTLWLVGDTDGALCASPSDFEHGLVSYAHLHPTGEIARYGRQIGTRADLQFTGRTREVTPAADAGAGLFGPSWGG